MLSEQLKKKAREFKDKGNNIRRIALAHAGYCVVLLRPDILSLSGLPVEVVIEGVKAQTAEVLGATLKPLDRQHMVNEVLASARRVLLADGFDQLVESLCRAYYIANGKEHQDPYEGDEKIWFTAKTLLDQQGAGALLDDAEQEFLHALVKVARDAIRHNNGIIPPGRGTVYDSKLHGLCIQADLPAGKPLKMELVQCLRVFDLMWKIGNKAFENLQSSPN